MFRFFANLLKRWPERELTMPAPTDAEMAEQLIRALANIYAWPWSVERDWGYDVVDKDGQTVASCRDKDMAEAIVAKGKAWEEERTRLAAETDAEFNLGVENG